MNISVVYADPNTPLWIELELEEGCTVSDAIERSGIHQRIEGLDLSTHKLGVYGKLSPLSRRLTEGDRVEIYTPICVDPKTVKRRTPG